MTLVRPTLAHKEQAVEMVAEFKEYVSLINGDGFLSDFLRDSSYEAWVEQLEAASDPATCPNGHAPALTYFGVRESDGRIVGMIDLRLELNDHLRVHGGHIGYTVRPSERGKHYATAMLKAALEIYKERGASELLLICSKGNAASAKVITNCGGILKDEIECDTEYEVLQRYTISLIRHHTMDLVPSAFEKIANGTKTIELRLNDPKRRAIAVGDHIVFRNTETDERLEVVVRARHEFATFEELYATLPLLKCGYSEEELPTAAPSDMYAYYTDEQIAYHGVVGLEICCL